MSISTLKKLVAPPAKPFWVETVEDWKKAEAKLGVTLPEDYREFIFAYGSGLFAGLYRIYNPFAKSEYTGLLTSVARVCDINRESQRYDLERFPYPYFPEPNGLLPWGNDENGNDYFWLTDGLPDEWIVVQDNNRGSGLKEQPFTMTGFLVAVLQKKVNALASGYPRKGDFKFEPYSADMF